ncbi:MAG: response regulator transcription factor [Flavobacteriales bacterium]|nr:response regulator transcription factor [Flavobacteriales bacterium]
MAKRPIRVAIVEDDKEQGELLSSRILRAGDMRLVQVNSRSDRFLESLPILDVDVVLMDINMPGKSGIDCVREAKPRKPQVQYLMLTVLESPAYIFQALCAGATGYLLKNIEPEELLLAVRDIYGGGSPMSSAIARLVVSSFQQQAQQRINDEQLTDREKQILDLLAQGLMYKEISAKTCISIETVRKHVRHIYEKLQVRSRMEAVRKVYPR